MLYPFNLQKVSHADDQGCAKQKSKTLRENVTLPKEEMCCFLCFLYFPRASVWVAGVNWNDGDK